MAQIVPQRLTELAKLYSERNALYGDDYKMHGKIMQAFFPVGIELRSVDDFNRYAIFQNLLTKLNRYVANWDDGHEDSLNDISVYAQMLQELDNDIREKQNQQRSSSHSHG